jgi:hypothetical protein
LYENVKNKKNTAKLDLSYQSVLCAADEKYYIRIVKFWQK